MLAFFAKHWLVTLIVVAVLAVIIIALRYGKNLGELAAIKSGEGKTTIVNPYILDEYKHTV